VLRSATGGGVMRRVTPADGRPNSPTGAPPAAHEARPGDGAADCASLAQPALHHKRMVVCPIPDHERKADKGREFLGLASGSRSGRGAGCGAGGVCGGGRGGGLRACTHNTSFANVVGSFNARSRRNESPRQSQWGRGQVAQVHRRRRISPPTYN
jgi:hypothetical protein